MTPADVESYLADLYDRIAREKKRADEAEACLKAARQLNGILQREIDKLKEKHEHQ